MMGVDTGTESQWQPVACDFLQCVSTIFNEACWGSSRETLLYFQNQFNYRIVKKTKKTIEGAFPVRQPLAKWLIRTHGDREVSLKRASIIQSCYKVRFLSGGLDGEKWMGPMEYSNNGHLQTKTWLLRNLSGQRKTACTGLLAIHVPSVKASIQYIWKQYRFLNSKLATTFQR